MYMFVIWLRYYSGGISFYLFIFLWSVGNLEKNLRDVSHNINVNRKVQKSGKFPVHSQ